MPFSLRLKFTLSLTPFWVYFLALVMTFLFNKRLISSLASTSLKNISLRFSSDDKNFLIDSYTKFVNKVGLTISNKHIKEINEMELSFPFKDCVLEGGQSKDDE
jgi:adenine specific DNA methylase Mod